MPHGKGQFWWIGAPIVKYRHFLLQVVQKRLNLSICRFDCKLERAEGCTSSTVFARWRQCALMEGHVAVTCRITLNHPSTAAMRLTANYFDHLLSLDMPSYTVAQIAKRFEPSTVLWHSTQYSHLVIIITIFDRLQNTTKLECGPMPNVMVALPNTGGVLCSTPQSLADAHYYMPCSNAAKTRKPLKFAGAPQTRQSVSAVSEPKFTIL